MKLNKVLLLLLSLLLIFSLTACGETAQQEEQPQDPPKSEYQLAYDKALTAFYLPDGIWQLELLDESGNPTDELIYLRFTAAETAISCLTSLNNADGSNIGGSVDHTTTVTGTSTVTTMHITAADAAIDLALGSINVGGRSTYNVTYTATLGAEPITAAGRLQALDADASLPDAAIALLNTAQ